jgi:C_GCAxxG_C_C family probable redox protein
MNIPRQPLLRSLNYQLDSSPSTILAYRLHSAVNLFHMGHCAPTVMKTLLDAAQAEQEWLVKLTAGMPGGIGNTGFECGGVTSPLILLGLRYGLGDATQGLPEIFYKGNCLLDQFLDRNKTYMCKEIRQGYRVPIPCIPVVCRSPETIVKTTMGDCHRAIPEARQEAYRSLYAYLEQNRFHCAHAVFQNLDDTIPVSKELLDGSAGFVGGTLFQGNTCSAFTAGVMAIGLMTGEIEDSLPRVIWMIGLMAMGKDAFGDHLNKFNKTMNTGYRLSKWFKKEFGSTQCKAITHCDFSSQAGVNSFIESDCVSRCRLIADQVAVKVKTVLGETSKIM